MKRTRRKTPTKGHLTGMSNRSNRETCQDECCTGLGTLWGTLFGAGRAEVFLWSTPPPKR